jgi:hypothetical protein
LFKEFQKLCENIEVDKDSQGWVPKKVVFTKILAHVSVSNKSIFKIKLSMTSPNVVLLDYTYNTSKKKVSPQLKNFENL